MEGFSKKSQDEKKGVASLFTDTELKSFYKKYLVFLGVLEVLILFGCWIFQLGSKEYNHFGSVDVQFPWKMYFLVSFLAPIAITFLGGVLVIAFNKYVHGIIPVPETGEQEQEGFAGRVQSFLNAMTRVPFLFSLILLAAGAGILYRIEDIISLLGNIGAVSFRYLAIGTATILGVGSVLWVVWMILNYKLKKKDMEFQYKREVMERTGMIFLDDKTVVNPEGRLLSGGNDEKTVIPQLSSAKEKTAEDDTVE